MNAGCLRPVSSRPQETVQAQSSRHLPSSPTAPSEASGLPALGLRLPTSSMLRAVRCPPSPGTTSLKPISTSSRRVILTEVLREPARPLSSHPLLTFESQQQMFGGFEGPEQDEFDKVLASMELEGPGMELELGVGSEATGILPTLQQEDSILAKKARVADLSRSCQKGPMPAPHMTSVMSVSEQNQPPDSVGHCRTPQPCLRPGATGNLPIPTASAVPAQQPQWEVSPKGPPLQGLQPLQATGRPIQRTQNHGPRQPFQSPNACLSGKSHFHGPRTPNSNCSTPSRTVSGFVPRGPLQPRAPMSSVKSPIITPKGPHSCLVPQAALQTPIVTNHLVQLVTAANRTPQRPPRTATQAKTRRFPGPAGILPHQVSDSFSLEAVRAIQDIEGRRRETELQHCPVPEYLHSWGEERKEVLQGRIFKAMEESKEVGGENCRPGKPHVRGVLRAQNCTIFMFVEHLLFASTGVGRFTDLYLLRTYMCWAICLELRTQRLK